MSTRVYIGRIDYATSERDVEKFFRGYGKINEVMLKNGFAFVDFADPRDADDACHDLSGKELNGYRVMVDIARGTPHGRDWIRDREKGYYGGVGWTGPGAPPGRGGGGARREYERSDYRIIIENVSSRISWQELKDTFRDEGVEVLYCTAHTTRKNEALMEFPSKNEMRRAIKKFDGADFNGRKIKMIEEKRRSRSRTRSRSESRSRSRSKSASRSRSRSPRRDKKSKRSSRRSESRSVSPDGKRRRSDGERNGVQDGN